MNKTRAFLLATLAAAFGIPGTASAMAMLYGNNFSGPSPLFSIDTGTGQATSIASAMVDVGDMTSNQVDTLWGVTLNSSNNLISIDALSGAITNTVALTGTDLQFGGGSITSLAYDPITGVLFGNTSTGFGDTVGGDDLYTIDPLSGAVSLVGRIGFDNVYALGFDQLGGLFGITNGGELISLNLATGNGSLIAGGLGGSLFDMASNPDDNTMFVSMAGSQSLATINLGTGALTPVGPYNNGDANNVVGLAFLADRSVPEPTTLALLGATLVMVRRRRA
ncbi:MAG: PEP-CTERM sorting domain-containing protein [Gammaproteobacteria bacterium]|nr:PEP-CTERM sorting domain-containing protein [Gammaproteobacteria bacterium]